MTDTLKNGFRISTFQDCLVIDPVGFYDNFIGATLDYYLKIKDKNKSPVNLILGPW